MKKFDKKFIKYSVTLFLVSVLFISIGTVSLTRSSARTDRTMLENASAKTRIEVLSNENMELKKQNEELIALNEVLKNDQQRYIAVNSVLEAEILIQNKDFENAKIMLERIDGKHLDGTFARGKYEKLCEIIKENLPND